MIKTHTEKRIGIKLFCFCCRSFFSLLYFVCFFVFLFFIFSFFFRFFFCFLFYHLNCISERTLNSLFIPIDFILVILGQLSWFTWNIYSNLKGPFVKYLDLISCQMSSFSVGSRLNSHSCSAWKMMSNQYNKTTPTDGLIISSTKTNARQLFNSFLHKHYQ